MAFFLGVVPFADWIGCNAARAATVCVTALAGDLLVVAVLRRLNGSDDILHEYPNLSAYVARGEARPAFRRAFDAQMAVFTAASTGR